MADGRQGRPPKTATDDRPAKVTVRVAGDAKNLMVEMAASYGLTIGEYLETLVRRDAAR